MSAQPTDQPFMALVDDDFYSARLLKRLLAANGAPTIAHLSDPQTALRQLKTMVTDPSIQRPELVIVDLKTSSAATRDFLAAIDATAAASSLTFVAMSSTLDRDSRAVLLDAGASAVFERHADAATYRAEVAALVTFWRRRHGNARLHSVA